MVLRFRGSRTVLAAALVALWSCGRPGTGTLDRKPTPAPVATPSPVDSPGPAPTPTEAPETCQIVGNDHDPVGPAVYETEICVSQGCFEQYLARALRLQPDGSHLREQPAMLLFISGDVTNEPGCAGLLTTEDKPFILGANSLDRGGVYVEILQDCVGPGGVDLHFFGTRPVDGEPDKYSRECSPWVVRLPEDVQPLP